MFLQIEMYRLLQSSDILGKPLVSVLVGFSINYKRVKVNYSATFRAPEKQTKLGSIPSESPKPLNQGILLRS